jgi:hypothetical protein
MPFQGEQRIVAIHAEAVIYHPNQTSPARLDFYRDTRRLRVDRILDQFLYHARRSFDYFTRRDLIRDMFGKQANAIHRQ